MAIKVQPFVIHENVLDLIGKQFAFDHAKGLAEMPQHRVRLRTEALFKLRERLPHHRMLPASSKTGMYISTTTRPTASPSTVIKSGSNTRVNPSTKRAVSSS